MTGSSVVLIALLSLTLVACIAGARKNPTDYVQPNIIDYDSKHGNGLFDHNIVGAELFKKDFELERPTQLTYPHEDGAKSKKSGGGDSGERFKKGFELEHPTHLIYHFEGDAGKPKEDKLPIKLFNKHI